MLRNEQMTPRMGEGLLEILASSRSHLEPQGEKGLEDASVGVCDHTGGGAPVGRGTWRRMRKRKARKHEVNPIHCDRPVSYARECKPEEFINYDCGYHLYSIYEILGFFLSASCDDAVFIFTGIIEVRITITDEENEA